LPLRRLRASVRQAQALAGRLPALPPGRQQQPRALLPPASYASGEGRLAEVSRNNASRLALALAIGGQAELADARSM